MKKTILSIILALATITVLAQDKLIRVADKASWKKDNPRTTLFDREKARLLMPQGATFGVECISSFSPEWTLTLAPPPEVLPPGTVRKLIVWKGTVLNDSLAEFRSTIGTIGLDDRIYFYRRHQMLKSISYHYEEDEKREFAERYGIMAKDFVMEFETMPDTLCDAYVRQHPELMQTRRYVEGYVLDEDGKPLADAWVYVHSNSRAKGAATDSIGRFAFWLPRTDTLLDADCGEKYKGVTKVPITDAPIIIRLERKGI